MAFILHIETATPVCSVAISHNNQILSLKESSEENVHSSMITLFIDECLKSAHIKMSDLNAISFSSGPGSYTGLRIGASTAKGLCYALKKPLIAVPTLKVMAAGLLETTKEIDKETLLCPMIDARRMEVYFAVYDVELNEIKPPSAAIVTEDFLKENNNKSIIFFGTGAEKCKNILLEKGYQFMSGNFNSANYMAEISFKKYTGNIFEDVAYFEPEYIKEFYTTAKRINL